MSSAKSWENLNITRDEVKSIAEALKNDEFRKLLVEYVEETQKPENRKKFQEEIIQLEAERGVDCKFVNPEPGFVIKTSIDGSRKAFINVCSNQLIGKPTSKPVTVNNNKRLSWSIPHSLTPGRDDYDKKANRCIVYDVVFHPDTLYLAQNTQQFKSLVIETAVKGVEDNFKVKLDQQNLKLPKMKYKGVPNPTVIRTKSTKPVNLSDEDDEFHKNLNLPQVIPKTPVEKVLKRDSVSAKYATPKYVIKHRSDIDIQEFTMDRNCKLNAAIPKELIVDINLPLLNTAKDVNLDIHEKSLSLLSEQPAKYKLNIKLPYEVSQNGNAKFDSDKRILTITLPVVRKTPLEKDYIREDSGIESDIGEVPNNEAKNGNEIMETSFLSNDQHYMLPQCDYNRENDSICFVLNVKNVDPISIKTKTIGNGFDLTFVSIGSGHFPIHYAFCARFNSELDDELYIEAWDNNVTVQVHLEVLNDNDSMWIGLSEEDLVEKEISSVLDLTKGVEALTTCDDPQGDLEDDAISDGGRETTPEDDMSSSLQDIPQFVPKARTYSEGSADESTGCGRRSILKNRMSRSLSESCADDATTGFPSSVLYTWSDSCISEQQEGESKEMKKTVRFSQHIQQQIFKANSSILGQRRKNQKKTRNKRRTLERRLSESENSEEGGDEREKWTKKRGLKLTDAAIIEPVMEEEEAVNLKSAIQKKKFRKPKNVDAQNQFVKELDD